MLLNSYPKTGLTIRGESYYYYYTASFLHVKKGPKLVLTFSNNFKKYQVT